MQKISVILPVYGVEKYIGAAVESVLKQTHENLEILIIDDASPDRSLEICRQFTDSRIKIISQENRGLAGARNTGIRHAQGEYLALLDGDDLWLPEKLERHVKHLQKSPTVGISFSRSAFIDEAGNSLGTYTMPKLKEITPLYLLRDNPISNGSTAVIRREVFEAIEFQTDFQGIVENFYFDECFRQAEDLECWLRVSLQTDWKIEGIPEALTLYRVNSGGLSANLLKQLEWLEKVLEKARSYAPDLIAQCEGQARAYQLRYLARSAVRLQEGSMAMTLMLRALAAHWQILIEEPRRTIMTLAAASFLCLLPRHLYRYIESLALGATGAVQRSRILKEKLRRSVS